MLLNGKNLKPEWFNTIQQMRNEEIDFLYQMVEQTEGDILEIGMGSSTFAFLDATKDTDRKVYSIDLKDKLKEHYDYITSVRRDSLTYWNNVVDNGIILYHDYNLDSVSRFVDSMVSLEMATLHSKQNNLVALQKIWFLFTE